MKLTHNVKRDHGIVCVAQLVCGIFYIIQYTSGPLDTPIPLDTHHFIHIHQTVFSENWYICVHISIHVLCQISSGSDQCVFVCEQRYRKMGYRT